MFDGLVCFDRDPLNLTAKLSETETLILKSNVEKAIKWTVEKLLQGKPKPIVITLASSGDQNPDIIKAFHDKRYMTNVYNLVDKGVKVFLTPNFLPYFDFNVATCREYLKARVKFYAIQVGFVPKIAKT